MQRTEIDVWAYRDLAELGYDPSSGKEIAGYEVEAIDGTIGKVDAATYDVSGSYVVVDTGPWIFGKKVMLPAGVIDRIDEQYERIVVNRTKDQIKNAPEFDETRTADTEYRGELGDYYRQGPGYRGWM